MFDACTSDEVIIWGSMGYLRFSSTTFVGNDIPIKKWLSTPRIAQTVLCVICKSIPSLFLDKRYELDI